MIIAAVTGLLMVAGALFALLAGLGVARLPDIYLRMHAATKAGTVGAGLVLASVAVHFADAGVALRVLAALVFLVLTAPLAAHLLGRAAYRGGEPLWSRSVTDEWNPNDPKSREDSDGTLP